MYTCTLHRWDFGNSSNKVIRSKPAPCQKMEGLVEKGEKQVYVQDSVNFTYSIPGNNTHNNTHKQCKVTQNTQF